jgi:hypothetical protein
MPDSQDQEDYNGGSDGREGNVDKLFEPSCPVYHGRFVKLGINTGKGGKVDDGSPSYPLPYIGRYIDSPVEVWGLKQGKPLASKKLDNIVKKTGGHGKIRDHPGNNDNRNKVGQIGDGLGEAFVSVMPHLVEQEGQNNGSGKTKQEIIKTDKKGIPQKAKKIGGIKKPDKMFQAYPGTSGEAPARREVLEGNQGPIHGLITEKGKKKNYRQD